MQDIKKYDHTLFKRLFSLTQVQLKAELSVALRKMYSDVTETDDFLIAWGELPVALIAHLDTVYEQPANNIYYDENRATFWSPDGLGADDRAGIYTILKLLQSKKRPTVIFTTDEEWGGVGAWAVAQLVYDENYCSKISQIKYLIELDRQGKDDCVFYQCGNIDFIQYVESFGFHCCKGTFSDISIIAPFWEKCAVNLSVGYYDEHTLAERLNVLELLNTYKKVSIMLNKSIEAPFFLWFQDPEYPWVVSWDRAEKEGDDKN